MAITKAIFWIMYAIFVVPPMMDYAWSWWKIVLNG